MAVQSLIKNHQMTLQHPELGIDPVPVIEPNVSPSYFELEREKIFKRVWLNVGREDDIPQPGDYFVKDIAVLNTSVIVLRGMDGKIRAFHNMCRHRGNKVAHDCGSKTRGFWCQFHGWAYDWKGNLIGVPGEETFYKLDKSKLGLVPFACETWEGFIFVHRDPQPHESLLEFMGELAPALHGFPFSKMTPRVKHRVVVKCNWKIFLDAFQEGLHVSFVHRRSLPDALTAPGVPVTHTPIELLNRHRRISVPFNPDAKLSPSQELRLKIGAGLFLQQSSENLPPGVNFAKLPFWAFDINVAFPNFRILMWRDAFWYENFWPTAVDETVWEVAQYDYAPQTPLDVLFNPNGSGPDPLREDLSTLETTQTTLKSGVMTHSHLSDEELAVRHAYKVVEDYIHAP